MYVSYVCICIAHHVYNSNILNNMHRPCKMTHILIYMFTRSSLNHVSSPGQGIFYRGRGHIANQLEIVFGAPPQLGKETLAPHTFLTR